MVSGGGVSSTNKLEVVVMLAIVILVAPCMFKVDDVDSTKKSRGDTES